MNNASRKLKTSLLILLAVFILAALIWWLYPPLHYNIRTVRAGQIYRSAELPTAVLKHVVTKDKVGSIINLRNMHPGDGWWQREMQVAEKHHAAFYNVALPAHGYPTIKQLRILTYIIQNAPKPLLIHCRQGIDRTGLASAIALILDGASIEDAQKQVSWRYLVLEPSSVGKEVLPHYAAWLKCHGYQSSRTHFYQWLALPAPMKTSKSCKEEASTT